MLTQAQTSGIYPMSEIVTNSDLQKVESFIFNDAVQDSFLEILGSVKNINIFEIVGISHYETKHSNTLSWLFKNHNEELSKYIFESFLKETIKITESHIEHGYTFSNIKSLEKLQRYIYLPDTNREIKVYREKNDIDLLIVDERNNFTFSIENKINHTESNNQLKKYRKYIEKTYKSYTNYFIFLTKDESRPSESSDEGEINREKYLLSSYASIADPITNMLGKNKSDSSLTNEELFILEHYLDMLIRKNIVPNEKLSYLCEKIWKNHSEALSLLIDHKPSGLQIFKSKLFEEIENNINLEADAFYNYSNTLSDRRLNTVNWNKYHLKNTSGKYKEEPLIYFGIYIVKSTMRIWIIRKDTNSSPEIWKALGGRKNSKRYDPYTVSNEDREKILIHINDEIIEKEVKEIVKKLIKIDEKFS